MLGLGDEANGTGVGFFNRTTSWPLIALVSVLAGLCGVAVVADLGVVGDAWWHLMSGRWMVAHGSVITHDPFSYTQHNKPWVDTEWGYEYVLGWLYRGLGLNAFYVWSFVCASSLAFVFGLLARERSVGAAKYTVVTLFATVLLLGFFVQVRGMGISYALVGFEVYCLWRARRDPWWLLGIAVSMIFWVNLHGSVLLGLFVLCIELFWGVVYKELSKRGRSVDFFSEAPVPVGWMLKALLCGVLACLLNPHGFSLLAYDYGVAGNSQIASNIAEWKTPSFSSLDLLLCLLFVLLGAGLLLWQRRLFLTELTVAAVVFLGALEAGRMLAYAVVLGAVCVFLARRLFLPRWMLRVGVVGVLAVSLATASGATRAHETATIPKSYAQMKLLLAAHPGRVLVPYDEGGWAIYNNRETFIDGRTDFFVGKTFANYIALSDGTKAPDNVLNAAGVTTVLWEEHSPLTTYLSHDPQWTRSAGRGQWVVFTKNPGS